MTPVRLSKHAIPTLAAVLDAGANMDVVVRNHKAIGKVTRVDENGDVVIMAVSKPMVSIDAALINLDEILSAEYA